MKVIHIHHGDFTPYGYLTLSTIPRASSVGATSGYIEENVIININRASSNFRHTLTCSFHNLVITIAEKTSDTTINWTIPSNFYEQIPNQKSSWGTIYCYTYNGDIQIGVNSCTFTVNTNESKCKPTLSAIVKDINDTTIALTGSEDKIVKYCSNAKVIISCSSKNSATISSKKVNNLDILEDNITIEKVSTNTFTVIVTDSRGYSTSQTIIKDMVNYIKPTANVQFSRKSPTSNEFLVQFDGNFFNGNFGSVSNVLKLKWRYKETNNSKYSDWAELQQVEDGNKYSNGTTAISLGTIFDYKKGYTFQFNYSDKLTDETITVETSRGEPILWWNKDTVGVNGDFEVTGILRNSTVLYESEAGTTGNVELNETVENYRYLEIFFHNEGVAPGYVYNSVKIYNPNGKIVALTIIQKDNTQNVIFMRTKNIKINKTTLEINGYSSWNTYNNIEETAVNTIYINAVIGYK